MSWPTPAPWRLIRRPGRAGADGYLFFRGLLPAEQIRATGSAVAAQLRSGGWITDRGSASATPRAVNPMDALADPAFRAA